MNSVPRYAKQPVSGRLEYEPGGVALSDRLHFELQVSLGDMPLEDALRIPVPTRFSKLTVGDLLNEIFSDDYAKQNEIQASLDVRANPDLPEIYTNLSYIFDQWRRCDCTLRFFINNGPEVELFQTVSSHLSKHRPADRYDDLLPVLDLVIEQKYEVLKRFVEGGGDKYDLLKWLRSSALLYFMDKHGYSLYAEPSDETDRRLLAVADDLAFKKLIAASEESGKYEITGEGRNYLGRTIAETESYIDQFDVFDDVFYDFDACVIEFGTSQGDDLRVQVIESEGLDPIRTVFLLRLYDGTLDTYLDSWPVMILTEEFFDEILRPVLDHPTIDEDVLGWIIEGGYAYNEEQAESSKEMRLKQGALKRIKAD